MVAVGEDEVATTTATVARRPTVPTVAAVTTADAMTTGTGTRIKTHMVAMDTRMATRRTHQTSPTRTTRMAHEAGLEMATEHLTVGAHPGDVEATTLATHTAARMATVPVVTEAEAAAVGTGAATEGVGVDMEATMGMAVVMLAMAVAAAATTVVMEVTVAATTPAMAATEPAAVIPRMQAMAEVEGTVVTAAVEAAVTEVLSKMAMVVATTIAGADTTRVAAQGDIKPPGLHLRCMSIVKLLAERSMLARYVYGTST